MFCRQRGSKGVNANSGLYCCDPKSGDDQCRVWIGWGGCLETGTLLTGPDWTLRLICVCVFHISWGEGGFKGLKVSN